MFSLHNRDCASCQTCEKTDGLFCNLPQQALVDLDRIKRSQTYVPREFIFHEGQPLDEVAIVCQGTVALMFTTSSGDCIMVGLAGPGEVLGLTSVMTGGAHDVSAQALGFTRVATVNKSEFLAFLERHPLAALNAGAELSHKINRAYSKIRLTGSGFSVQQKVAAWLLQESKPQDDSVVTLPLTHERIAQLLDVSRESVTRSLSAFKRAGAIQGGSGNIRICNRQRLQAVLQPSAMPHMLSQAV
jgi:CRP/FNR family transcriptional regulator, cyclic AMP receptor protein